MIFKESIISIIDNSGAKKIKCIQLQDKKKYNYIGHIIKGSVIKLRKKRRFWSKVKKKQLVLVLLLYTKTNFFTKNNYRKTFLKICGIPLTYSFKPYGTSIFCKISKYFRYTKYFKLIMLGGGVVN